VDESWLVADVAKTRSRQYVSEPEDGELSDERQVIESVLADCGGKVYGVNGAAARLRIPPSTLDSKIKKLQIHKNRFKRL
jgi:transcriptional regulator with GAF, ATPase, and Fis domain